MQRYSIQNNKYTLYITIQLNADRCIAPHYIGTQYNTFICIALKSNTENWSQLRFKIMFTIETYMPSKKMFLGS